MGRKEKFDPSDSGGGSSGEAGTCKPTPPSFNSFGEGFVNGLTSFLGWGNVYNSIGGEDQVDNLTQQAEKLQTITPKLIQKMAILNQQITDELMETALNTSRLAILQTQYTEKILQNGTSIDKLIIVMSIALLMIVVLFFTIIR